MSIRVSPEGSLSRRRIGVKLFASKNRNTGALEPSFRFRVVAVGSRETSAVRYRCRRASADRSASLSGPAPAATAASVARGNSFRPASAAATGVRSAEVVVRTHSLSVPSADAGCPGRTTSAST